MFVILPIIPSPDIIVEGCKSVVISIIVVPMFLLVVISFSFNKDEGAV